MSLPHCTNRRCVLWVPRHVRLGQNVLLTAAVVLAGPVVLLETTEFHIAAYSSFAVALALIAYGLVLNSPRGYFTLFWWRYRRKRAWYARTARRPQKVVVERTDEKHVFIWRHLIGPLKGNTTRTITSSPRTAYFYS